MIKAGQGMIKAGQVLRSEWCPQTLQSAGSLGSRTNTTSVFSSALDSYPNVKTCASSSSTSSSGSASTETAGR